MTKHKKRKNKKPKIIILQQEETVEEILKMMEDIDFSVCNGGIRHCHTDALKRNALFLIKSSEKIEEYALSTLIAMKEAYKHRKYKRVIDLAYLHDKTKRPNNFIDSDSSPCNEIVSNLTDLLKD